MHLLKLYSVALLLCGLLTTLAGCSTDSSLETNFPNLEGSFDQPVQKQRATFTLKTNNNFLIAGTASGLHQLDLANNTWNTLGVNSAEVRAFTFINDEEILAALNFNGGDSLTIAKTTNRGQEWFPFRNNYGGGKSRSIPASMDQSNKNASVLYAGGSLLSVAKSTNQGTTWEVQLGSWEGFGSIQFIRAKPEKSKVVWSGGTTATFQPFLAKSTDSGNSWQQITVLENVETTVHDVAIHPSQSNTILAGMAGTIDPANIIRKSTDGGQSWTTTFSRAGVYTLARSARNPEVVYASGQNQDGTLFFAASGDFGDHWQTVTMPDSPTGIRVNDMVSVMEGGQEVLYLGTNEGIYSYRFAE